MMLNRRQFTLGTLLAGAAASLPATARSAAPVTLRVWDQFTDENTDAGMKALVAGFEKANPTITIQRDAQQTEDMRPIVQTALASGTGPDVIYYDTGPGYGKVLADAGLLMPLDSAYAAGDFSHVYDWTKARTTYGGKVYGIGNELETYWAYYNADMFKQLKLDVPKTYPDFLKVCAAIKQAGTIPVAFADQGGWPAYHLFSVYLNNLAGKATMESLLLGTGSWDTPVVVEAIKDFFVDMNKAGYLIPDATAVKYDDAINLFNAGQAGMHISGTWAIGNIEGKAPFELGWFFVPKPDGGALPPAGLGSGYFVSSKTQQKDAAIKFLSYLFDPANARIWMEQMLIIPPYQVDASSFKLPALFKAAIGAIASHDMGYNIDVMTPDKFNTAMGDGFQAVLIGQKTPEQQAKDLQAAMVASRES
jgi:raffinose/stachyose/melibiose transport system substrate-binding protein